MTLQELIGELTALSMAYPPETPVHLVIPSHGYTETIDHIELKSTPAGVTVEMHTFI